jgi:TrwC relaxase
VADVVQLRREASSTGLPPIPSDLVEKYRWAVFRDPPPARLSRRLCGKEPPGRWWGPGAEALGFARGQRVDREPYDLLFGERKGPDGARLGRPPRFAEARERYREVRDQLLTAEPHATAEREAELRIEAAKRARLSPLYMDLTVSFSKSVSVF